MGGPSKFRKTRFYLSVGAVYVLTLLFAVHSLASSSLVHKPPQYAHYNHRPPIALARAIVVTSGKPIRVTVPRLGIDLPVDDGLYDVANQSWTLSGYHAQFALSSVDANDYQGNTFIYGHNNPYVFGKLKALVPGDIMQLYTDNGYIFSYTYKDFGEVQPDDNSVFRYYGPPTTTIQTCSGAFNELRRMYHFDFAEVHHA